MRVMNEKRIYVKGCVGDRWYAGHMTKRDAAWTFDSYEELSKAEYLTVRAGGMQSWGEYETQCRREGCEPQRRRGWAW